MNLLRRLLKATLLLAATGAVLAGGLFGLYIHQRGWARWRHERLVARIDHHLNLATTSQAVSGPERGRQEIIRAIHTALYNWPLYHPKSTVPGKFRAIVDRLDANNGADLQTFAGCVELLVLFDHASPTFHDYPWVTRLYDMSADGTIPRLPELGREWPKETTPGQTP